MTFRFSILAFLLTFTLFTSCESEESDTTPFTAEQVATSPEWKDYADQVDHLMVFFSNGAIDMQKVQAISNATPDGPDYQVTMDAKVASIAGGPEYLALSKQVEESRQRVMDRFGVPGFGAKMTEKINRAYRVARTNPIGQNLPQ